MAFKKKFMAKSPFNNYQNPEDYKVFNMGNEPSAFLKETNYLDDKRNPPKKNKDSKSGPPKGKIGSEYRKKEYDARGWKYDDTIAGYNKDGSKIASKAPVKPKKKIKVKESSVEPKVEPKKKKTKVGKWLKKNFGKGRKIKLRGSGKGELG